VGSFLVLATYMVLDAWQTWPPREERTKHERAGHCKRNFTPKCPLSSDQTTLMNEHVVSVLLKLPRTHHLRACMHAFTPDTHTAVLQDLWYWQQYKKVD
jgi:hypothetical protein